MKWSIHPDTRIISSGGDYLLPTNPHHPESTETSGTTESQMFDDSTRTLLFLGKQKNEIQHGGLLCCTRPL